MLDLARKVGETIIIDDDIKITVMDIQGNHITLGIDASKEMKVYRKEVYDRIQSEKDVAW